MPKYTEYDPLPAFDGTEVATLTKDGVSYSFNYADLVAYIVAGVPTSIIDDTAGNGDTDKVWSADKVFDYIASQLAGLLEFAGSIDCSANPNYPAANKGDAYLASVAGKIGGASGEDVNVGDLIIASADNAGGTEASVGASWFVLEHNIPAISLTGYLEAIQNLADLDDAGDARTNLDVYSTSEVDALFAGAGYSDEEARDAIGTALVGAAGIGITVSDGSDTITIEITDAELLAIRGLASAANKIIRFSGSGTADLLDFSIDGTLAGNSDTTLVSEKAIKTAIASAVAGLLDYKGATDCSANPNYPAALKGDAYVVSVAGKIGGASGPSVEPGDFFFAKADNAGGTEASVGASWDILQFNAIAYALLSGATFSGAVVVPDDAYDASTWNGSAQVPTKNAIRDKIEAMNLPAIQTITSSATVTPTFADDGVIITAQAAALAFANPTGTAADMWGIAIRVKDNGTPRAISFGTQYRAIGVTLPTTTVANKTLYLGMTFNVADTKWDVTAVAQEA